MNKEMFQNERYITRGIKENVSPYYYLFLWKLIDDMVNEEKDYLQVFRLRNRLSVLDGVSLIEVEHSQEDPSYKQIHKFFSYVPVVDTKVIAIDDGQNSIMFLSDEC